MRQRYGDRRTRHSGTMIETEKNLERRLAREVEKAGGWSLKLLSTYIKGLPDRLVLMPGGRVAFAEVKTTGKKPTKIQLHIHRRLKRLGFTVVVIDTSAGIDELLKTFE